MAVIASVQRLFALSVFSAATVEFLKHPVRSIELFYSAIYALPLPIRVSRFKFCRKRIPSK